MSTTEVKKISSSDLRMFTGTEQYHRFSLYRKCVLTDGLMYVVNNCECVWLFTDIAAYQNSLNESFQIWSLTKLPNNKALLECRADSNCKPCVSKEYDYTDFFERFSEDKFEFYVCKGELIVFMLKSEY